MSICCSIFTQKGNPHKNTYYCGGIHHSKSAQWWVQDGNLFTSKLYQQYKKSSQRNVLCPKVSFSTSYRIFSNKFNIGIKSQMYVARARIIVEKTQTNCMWNKYFSFILIYSVSINKVKCSEHSKQPVSINVLIKMGEDMNISVFPCQCDTCFVHRYGNQSDEQFEAQRKRKGSRKKMKIKKKRYRMNIMFLLWMCSL